MKSKIKDNLLIIERGYFLFNKRTDTKSGLKYPFSKIYENYNNLMKDINHVKKLRRNERWKVKLEARTIKNYAEEYLDTIKNIRPSNIFCYNVKILVIISKLEYPWNHLLTEQMDITLYLSAHENYMENLNREMA